MRRGPPCSMLVRQHHTFDAKDRICRCSLAAVLFLDEMLSLLATSLRIQLRKVNTGLTVGTTIGGRQEGASGLNQMLLTTKFLIHGSLIMEYDLTMRVVPSTYLSASSGWFPSCLLLYSAASNLPKRRSSCLVPFLPVASLTMSDTGSSILRSSPSLLLLCKGMVLMDMTAFLAQSAQKSLSMSVAISICIIL